MHDSALPLPAAPAGASSFLLDLASHPDTPAALGVGAAAWLWLGSQFPQALVLPPVADGWPRADLLQLQALGLERVAGSVVVAWLLVVGALVAAVRIRVGWRRREVRDAAGWLLAIAACLGLGIAYTSSRAAPPLLVEAELGAPSAPLVSWGADAGALARSGERWAGACHARGAALRCDLRGPDAAGVVELGVAAPARLGFWGVAWVQSAPAVPRGNLDLRWRGAQDGRAPLAAVRLGADATVRVPSLGAKLVATAPASLGPVLVAVPAAAATLSALGPAGLGSVAGGAAEHSGRRIRLMIARSAPVGHPGLGVACAGLALGAAGLSLRRRRSHAAPAEPRP